MKLETAVGSPVPFSDGPSLTLRDQKNVFQVLRDGLVRHKHVEDKDCVAVKKQERKVKQINGHGNIIQFPLIPKPTGSWASESQHT